MQFWSDSKRAVFKFGMIGEAEEVSGAECEEGSEGGGASEGWFPLIGGLIWDVVAQGCNESDKKCKQKKK